MIKYGVNIDLVKKLIEKMIFSKTDLFTGVDIDLDDSGRKIFIFATFYINNSKLGKYEVVQLIPSELVITRFPVPLLATATNRSLP